MKEKLRAKIKEIRESMPKDQWAAAIKAASAELAEPEKIEALNLPATFGNELELVKTIVSDDENIIVRYLREAPTVGIKTVEIVKDGAARNVIQRVICAGIPFGVMVAFRFKGELHIGWSRRHSGKELRHGIMKSLFEDTIKMMKDTRMVEKVSRGEAEENYDALLTEFAQSVSDFLKSDLFNDIENVPFAKRTGKLTAVSRGLKDTVLTDGKAVLSGFSGPIPGEIAKALPRFIQQAEEKFGCKAKNVRPLEDEGDALVASNGTAIAVAE
jgi:hypothetical protein